MNAGISAGNGRTGIEQVGDLPLGVALELLRNRRRRLVLDALSANAPADYDDVVDYVVREEAGLGYSSKERKRVYVALYQNHVPKLDDADVVEFDGTSKPLMRGGEFGSVYAALRRLRSEATRPEGEVRPPWRRLRDLLRGDD